MLMPRNPQPTLTNVITSAGKNADLRSELMALDRNGDGAFEFAYIPLSQYFLLACNSLPTCLEAMGGLQAFLHCNLDSCTDCSSLPCTPHAWFQLHLALTSP
jgi:hypothetical protein